MASREADIVPKEKRKLRACMLCGLIKSNAQFKKDGCENCDEVLNLKKNKDRVAECTSATFDGVVALMQPDRSWVARWQRVDKFTKGLYAIRVTGQLPDDIIDELEDRGIKYRPRDGSVVT
ncbi:transcription elongation factor spt4 [Quaeritorhiza haematococci]|nr:transcription elongation factor spt4 [Quaeritorhiza haematococci]